MGTGTQPLTDGSEDYPWLIEDLDDFDEFVSNSIYWGQGVNTKLAIDIDLTEKEYCSSVIEVFEGVFDGDNHVIDNLTIKASEEYSGDLGFWGTINDSGSISNLAVINCKITGSNIRCLGILVGLNSGTISYCHTEGEVKNAQHGIGGLIGQNNSGTVSNCHASVNVSGMDAVGGLIGDNCDSIISHCYATGEVRASYTAGGLIGKSENSDITDCYATGSVIGSMIVGGLIAESYEDNISNCYATGNVFNGYNERIEPIRDAGGLVGLTFNDTISNCYATGKVLSYLGQKCGGLIGSDFAGTILDCYATGEIYNEGFDPSSIGGLVGACNGIISECYASSNIISHTHSMSNSDLGGLIGNLSGESSQITNCYAAGKIETGDEDSDIGGLCGRNHDGYISNCYTICTLDCVGDNIGGLIGGNEGTMTACFWDTQACGIANAVGSGLSDGGEGKTTIQMQTLSTFANAYWDFSIDDGDEADWQMIDNYYPVLSNQPSNTEALPDVIGLPQTQAETLLATASFETMEFEYVYSETISSGLVISQSPQGGIDLPNYTKIKMQISLGIKYPGEGEYCEPYQISTAAHWQALMHTPSDWESYKNFILTNDIDLSGIRIIPVGNIGNFFQGEFDGQGYTIHNILIDNSSGGNTGLFGAIDNIARIRNLNLENVSVKGNQYTGGLIGFNYEGVVSNCNVMGNISGNFYTGGLIGYNRGGEVSNCTNNASVTGGINTGGLIGWNFNGDIKYCANTSNVTGEIAGGLIGKQEGILSFCHSTGDVSTNNGTAGGLCGINYYGLIRQCYASGNTTVMVGNAGGLCGINGGLIWQCYASGDATVMAGNTGGLCGINEDDITQCYATGTVTCPTPGNVGGLCGHNEGDITQCYATGTVTCPAPGNVGGLVGYSDSYYIYKCYSTGRVLAVGENVGGLIGNGYASWCLWDIQTSGQEYSAGGIGMTTEEMKNSLTYIDIGWYFYNQYSDVFETTWRMCADGVDYPRFTWEHYNNADYACPNGTDLVDYALFAQYFLEYDCGNENENCYVFNLNHSGTVDFEDCIIFSQYWLLNTP